MNKRIKIFWCLFIVLLSGCKEFVEIDPPQDKLITANVFINDATATSAITGLYASMQTPTGFKASFDIAVNTGMYSDELDYKLTTLATQTVYKNSLIAKDSPTNSIWSRAYNIIYQANSVIEGLEKSIGVTENVKNQITGEALFMRAFWHFYLVNLYGDVPLVTTTDYTINSKMPRTDVNRVYEQIAIDLIKAKLLLLPKYVDETSIGETTLRVRPNSFTAAALLARVYLYTQKWKLAEDEATNIINNNSYIIENLANVFMVTSKEAIWQLQMPTPVNFVTYEARDFVLTAPPSGTKGWVISPSLLTKFSDNDLRKINWIGLLKANSVDYYYPYKYKIAGTSPVDEQIVCFRLAEQYLIRAEARAQQNNLALAIEDVDIIRGRAGLTEIKDTNPNISKEDLLSAIFDERQKEFFCEWGHRWLDLKRTNQANAVMGVLAPQKGGVWSDDKSLWPIPQNDIDNNKNIIQNKGYE